MALLKPRLGFEEHKRDFKGPTSTTDAPTLHAEWLCWKDQEQQKRVTWASFEYDCSLCTLTGRRGAVDLSELPSKLPCSEALWDAPSAQAWNALMSHLSPIATEASFPDMLRNVLHGKPIPTSLTPWSRRLCAQVCGRLLWDLKQLEIMSMSEFLGLPSLLTAQRQTKSVLMHGLINLAESMDSPTSTGELINSKYVPYISLSSAMACTDNSFRSVTGLICHYSHLYTAENVMDLVIFVARASLSPRSKHVHPELQLVKRRLQSKLASDPRQTRKMVWHAAQIIVIANRYLVSAPCEILRIFMGYIFIIAVVKFCPQIWDAFGQSTSVRLDLANNEKRQKIAIAEWIQYGGRASIGSADDVCTKRGVQVVSQEAQSMLQKVHFWGLAEKFTRIIARFEDSED